MKVKLQKIISGVVCLMVAVSSMAVPGNLIADAVNLDSPAIVNATATEIEDETKRTENGLYYEIYDYEESYVIITGYDESAGSEVIIPEMIEGSAVISIWDSAFYDCTSLTSVTIPNSVTRIRGWSLGCSSLETIYVDPENPNYSDVDGVLFSKDQKTLLLYPKGRSDQSYSIPDYVTEVGSDDPLGFDSPFAGCSALESVIIPDGVTEIKYSTFEACPSLTSVTIPDSVTNIGSWAFSECSSLKSITIPDSVTSIEQCAFSECPVLESITIPDSVTNIGNSVFSDCSSLTAIQVDPENQNYIDIDGVLFSKDQTELSCYPAGKSDQAYTIPSNVTAIGWDAFRGCSSLASVTIQNPDCEIGGYEYTLSDMETIYGYPDSTAQAYAEKYNREFVALDENPDTAVSKYLKYEIHEDYVEITGCDTSAEGEIMIPDTIQGLPVTSIGMGAFEYCSALETVIIPESVVTIGEEAFWRCSALKAVTISENVVNIELNAFFGCSALESITIQNPDCEIDDDKNTLSDTAVIYGYPDSTAQAYAEKYNREFVALDENPVNSEILWGDANDDGTVDISDVVLMNRVYVGVDQVSDEGMKNADVDQSGKIELSDSMNVLKLLVHLLEPDNFPIGQ